MVSLRSGPPPPAAAVQQWAVADYTELRAMRASLRQAIDGQLLPPSPRLDDLAEHMSIVATELTTNALRHGQSEAVVRLSRSATVFVVDVADEMPSVPPRLHEPQTSQIGGRGLHIVQELATDTGWYLTSGHKHVWAQFRIPRRVRQFPAPRISVFDLKTFVRLLRRTGH
ncbi:ATP-binding protein [Actinoplanes sp. TFC3]|uniref:ATP-binding protein n=1 Tax=Actinoplanes sp. TFC3 TaxID=1710355 RepID=UPI0009EBF503|nr:ATP-binding protein [Actinoplanes sp. TFC3]